MTSPPEPPNGSEGAKSRPIRIATPRVHASGSDLIHLAAAIEALFDCLVRASGADESGEELRAQLGEFRDQFHWDLERIQRTYARGRINR